MKLYLRIILILCCALMASQPAFANGADYTDTLGYFGVPSDNVGIGSSAPGQKLDVNGTARMTGFTLTGEGAASGNVLVSNNVGVGTWMSATTLPGAGSGSSGWTATGNNVYETLGGNVGIGTTLLTTAALTVMNGNVGIGTWKPAYALDVGGSINADSSLNIGGSFYQLENDGSNGLQLVRPSYGEVFDINGSYQLCLGYYCQAGPGNTTVTINRNGLSGLPTTGGIATDLLINDTLVAEANNDVLTALSITPTFTNGAFTGVKDYGLIVSAGNVGIGSTNPGQTLDITGTVRTIGLTMSGRSPIAGYVLTASDSAGDATWSAAGGVDGWTVTGNNVYETDNGNVGIGTNLVTTAALTVMNGNVGIGTWVPSFALSVLGGIDINKSNLDFNINSDILTFGASTGTDAFGFTPIIFGNNNIQVSGAPFFLINPVTGTTGNLIEIRYGATPEFDVTAGGYVGIGSATPSNALSVTGGAAIGSLVYAGTAGPSNGLIVAGNVGIGSTNPGQALDVTGTVRTIGLTMSGRSPIAGYVLTASDSAGDVTWSAAGGVDGWTVTGSNVYQTFNGNVGIGTNLVTTAALTVMNGNVGIGTWVPSGIFVTQSTSDAADLIHLTAVGATGYQLASMRLKLFGTVGVGAGNGLAFDLADSAANDITAAMISDYWTNNTSGSALSAMAFNLNATGGPQLSTAALTLYPYGTSGTGGNVGIGTWAPRAALEINTSNANNNGNVIVASGNVGIGTAFVGGAGEGALTVMNGNVGIGTWVPSNIFEVVSPVTGADAALIMRGTNAGASTFQQGSLRIRMYGTVGLGVGNGLAYDMVDASGIYDTVGMISSYWVNNLNASQQSAMAFNLDVGGGPQFTTAAMTIYPYGSGGTGGNIGIGTWVARAALDINTTNANNNGNVFVENGNVGIGTTFVGGAGEGALTVMNGNVGIGTWVPGALLQLGPFAQSSTSNEVDTAVVTTNFIPTSGTAVNDSLLINPTINQTGGASGITRGIYVNPTLTSAANFRAIEVKSGNSVFQGNVGVGSIFPGQMLDVQGTTRTVGFTMSGQAPISGYVLTASDSAGDTTWSPLGGVTGVSGWTVSVNNVYESNGGNVGIGTSLVTTAALTVMNGNVGIGTWKPAGQLDVEGTLSTAIFGGNVGIGTLAPPALLYAFNPTVNASLTVQSGASTLFSNIRADGDLGPNYFVKMQYSNSGQLGTSPNATPNSAYLETGSGTTGGIDIETDAAAPIIFTTGGITFTNERMIIDQNGNVGIGTIAPVAILNVVGNIGIGTGINSPYVTTLPPSGGMIVQGNVGIGSLTPGQKLDLQGTLRVLGGGSVGIGTSLVTTSALTVMNGNVGIGTWVPETVLHVSNGPSNISVTQYMLTLNANGIDTEAGQAFGIAQIGFGPGPDSSGNPGANAATMVFSSVYSDSFGGKTPNYLFKGLTSATDVSITNGTVGIGVDKPVTTFQVNGTSYLTNSVGIGTSSPGSLFSVLGGASLGSYATNAAPAGGIIASGNVGIGSITPGQKLDVTGTVRAIGLTMSGQIPIAGYVMTASDSAGDATWSSPGMVGGWTVTGNNVYETDNGNVGIGTSLVTTAALTVMNGNVGIGTWMPTALLEINNHTTNAVVVTSSGNVGIGTWAPSDALEIEQGNVGINTSFLGGAGEGALTVMGGSVGIGTWVPYKPFSVTGDSYHNGNIGIGTTLTTTSAMTVMNGNVGLGTWVPSDNLQVGTYKSSVSGFSVDTNGNVGIGTTTTSNAALSVMSGNVGIGTAKPPYQLYVSNTGYVTTLTTNKSTFMEVSYGRGTGTDTNYTLTAAFTQIRFSTITGVAGNYTLTDNGGNFSVANNWYVVPVSGIYFVHTKLRVSDSATQFISYGQGSGTVAADSPTFLWQQTVTTTASRNGSENVRIAHFTAGNDVFMFTYAGTSVTSSDGDFSIYLLTAD